MVPGSRLQLFSPPPSSLQPMYLLPLNLPVPATARRLGTFEASSIQRASPPWAAVSALVLGAVGVVLHAVSPYGPPLDPYRWMTPSGDRHVVVVANGLPPKSASWSRDVARFRPALHDWRLRTTWSASGPAQGYRRTVRTVWSPWSAVSTWTRPSTVTRETSDLRALGSDETTGSDGGGCWSRTAPDVLDAVRRPGPR